MHYFLYSYLDIFIAYLCRAASASGLGCIRRGRLVNSRVDKNWQLLHTPEFQTIDYSSLAIVANYIIRVSERTIASNFITNAGKHYRHARDWAATTGNHCTRSGPVVTFKLSLRTQPLEDSLSGGGARSLDLPAPLYPTPSKYFKGLKLQ